MNTRLASVDSTRTTKNTNQNHLKLKQATKQHIVLLSTNLARMKTTIIALIIALAAASLGGEVAQAHEIVCGCV